MGRDRFWINRLHLDRRRLLDMYSFRRSLFESSLFPPQLERVSKDKDCYFRILVTMRAKEKAVTQIVEIGRPRFPWCYDLGMDTNILLATRQCPQVTPHDQELNWVALNICDFESHAEWEFFETIVTSLRHWADYTREIVIDLDHNRLHNEQQKKSVQVFDMTFVIMKRK